MFTFLHAADIHLDSPLRGLGRYEGAPADEIRDAPRRAFVNLVDLAIAEGVAFVILAGDLYDGDWPDFDTGLFFVKQMSRLREAEIPVFGVYGNHDAASKITRRLRLPDNVTFFPTGSPATHHVDDARVAIHGQSFGKQSVQDDLARGYPDAVAGAFNIGVLHTSLNGREGHDSYAPCSEATLRDSGYDYWALGHIHAREILPGSPTIAFPGNIQGRHIRESGEKGCLLVTVDDSRTVSPVFMPLDVLRWATIDIVLDEVEEREAALGLIRERLEEEAARTGGRPLAARVICRGTTPLADEIAADREGWIADVRAVGLDLVGEGVWIEQVKNETRVPTSEGIDEDSPLAELAAVFAELEADEESSAELSLLVHDLREKLPRDLKQALPAADDAWWRDLVGDARAKLFAVLRN